MFFAAAPLFAQDATTSDAPPEIPFADWIRETNRADLPWSVEVSPPQLSILQRLTVEFRVRVPAKALARLGPTYQLFLEVRVKEAGAAGWLDERGTVGTRLLERVPKQAYFEFSTQALVRPGDYTAGFVLFDRVSGLRSVATRSFKVRALSGDPLPDISRDLPPVEFFQRAVDQEREPLREIKSRLWLPVPTRRPVQIELLVNFAATEPTTPSPGMSGLPETVQHRARSLRTRHQQNLARMLGIVKVFSQMEIPSGSLHITAVDTLRRSIIFEQDAAGGLNWRRLSAALDQMNPLSIPVQALAGRRQNAAFFRDVLERRLAQSVSAPPAHAGNGGNGGSDGASPASEPLRVFIVVSAPVIFDRGSDLSPVAAPRGRDYRIYHLQYRFGAGYDFDDLSRLLRNLTPRRFYLQTAEDFRRAMARLLADLRAL
ncbi:MAG TPA: hypothetical protein VGQ11_06420 [Candidatus Acidoferrales bacterium]|nr:hypothetical protein [Candidatus Acidoferrales bacterium]